ncbi:MAG: NAD(P)H-binding protein [Solirubrobacteraceae bacterium]
MRILLTGASGFAGAALLPNLLEEGHEVRALVRNRERFHNALTNSTHRAPLGEVELVVGDALTGAGLAHALREVEVAYYLIHSMEPSLARDPFPARERLAAENFAAAARLAGVRRVVYLGGLLPQERTPSPHLASRLAVEQILLEAIPDSIALRASVIVGARSRSFRFLVRLVERLPVLVLPAWRRFRTQPIDERDVVEMLLRCATSTHASGNSFDVGGPDVVSYEEMVKRIAELMIVGRPTIGLNFTATPIAARVAAVLASENAELFLPLMEGLTADLLPSENGADALLGRPPRQFDSAIEHALREWERSEPLAAR